MDTRPKYWYYHFETGEAVAMPDATPANESKFTIYTNQQRAATGPRIDNVSRFHKSYGPDTDSGEMVFGFTMWGDNFVHIVRGKGSRVDPSTDPPKVGLETRLERTPIYPGAELVDARVHNNTLCALLRATDGAGYDFQTFPLDAAQGAIFLNFLPYPDKVMSAGIVGGLPVFVVRHTPNPRTAADMFPAESGLNLVRVGEDGTWKYEPLKSETFVAGGRIIGTSDGMLVGPNGGYFVSSVEGAPFSTMAVATQNGASGTNPDKHYLVYEDNALAPIQEPRLVGFGVLFVKDATVILPGDEMPLVDRRMTGVWPDGTFTERATTVGHNELAYWRMLVGKIGVRRRGENDVFIEWVHHNPSEFPNVAPQAPTNVRGYVVFGEIYWVAHNVDVGFTVLREADGAHFHWSASDFTVLSGSGTTPTALATGDSVTTVGADSKESHWFGSGFELFDVLESVAGIRLLVQKYDKHDDPRSFTSVVSLFVVELNDNNIQWTLHDQRENVLENAQRMELEPVFVDAGFDVHGKVHIVYQHFEPFTHLHANDELILGVVRGRIFKKRDVEGALVVTIDGKDHVLQDDVEEFVTDPLSAYAVTDSAVYGAYGSFIVDDVFGPEEYLDENGPYGTGRVPRSYVDMTARFAGLGVELTPSNENGVADMAIEAVVYALNDV